MIKDQATGAIVVYRNSERTPHFLLVKQAGNYWAFPKGHKEGAETPLETAKRELEEETGITEVEWQEKPIFITEYNFNKDGQEYFKTNTYFLAFASEKLEGAPQPKFAHEILDSAWVTYSQARELLNYPPFVKVLDEVKSFLDSWNLKIC